jgi:hypothetical protein
MLDFVLAVVIYRTGGFNAKLSGDANELTRQASSVLDVRYSNWLMFVFSII